MAKLEITFKVKRTYWYYVLKATAKLHLYRLARHIVNNKPLLKLETVK